VLKDYEPLVGKAEIEEIEELAERVKGITAVHVNSTKFGGGVAELLHSLVPLANSLGLKVSWLVMEGSEAFFNVTKSFHNALQGMPLELTDEMKNIYLEYGKRNAEALNLDADLVIIHDPQPASIIEYYNRRMGKWIWRCHIDLTEANPAYWNFLSRFVMKYDALVFSLERYIKEDVKTAKISIIPPSLDPLTDKNKPLTEEQISTVLKRFNIDPDRPILIQVARFDPWKDPLGVIDVYRLVKREFQNLQLILVGVLAADDPEGVAWLDKTRRYSSEDQGVHILTNLDGVGAYEVNALQRASDVAIQKSIREGFGISVTEALWKGVPVVATRAGGIPLQVIDGVTGYLVNTVEEAAARVLSLLRDPAEAKKFGAQGRDHIRRNFLVTRHLKQYLKLALEII